MSRSAQATAPAREYATTDDFCGIFRDQMNRLYFLSLLLTGDEQQAEQCFLASFEACLQSQRVFKDWTLRWATHTIIKTAIQMISPARLRSEVKLNTVSELLVHVLRALPPLDRFAYLMTVIEKYSDLESATFLGCASKDVRDARGRALIALGASAPNWQIEDSESVFPVADRVRNAIPKAC